jgi:serine protease Do
MLDPIRTKAKWIALTSAAFVGGVAFASGLDWTPGSHAAAVLQASASTSAPAAEAVQPVADMSHAFAAISETVTPGVVTITTQRRSRANRAHQNIPPELREMFPFFRTPEGQQEVPQEAGGSGFFITPDGYIMTNNHVIEGAEKIDVVLQNQQTLRARVIGRDPTTDIAIIKVEGSNFSPLRLGRSEASRVGEWVLAIGNPLSLGNTVTAGIISAKGRPLNIIQQTLLQRGAEAPGYAIEDFIQTDAAINPGNSGGPLVNLRGEVIGVNTAIYSQTGFNAGYGFAVPIDLARRVGDDLIQYGRVRRPVLGVQIQPVTPEDAEVYRLPSIAGAVVQGFSPESPAQRAGLQQGDVIVSVDGRPIERSNQLQREVASKRPGDNVPIEFIRYGERRRAQIRLGEAPAQQMGAAEPEPEPARASEGRLGIQVSDLTPQLTQRLEAQAGGQLRFSEARGVVVTQVQPYGVLGRRNVRAPVRVLQMDRAAVRDVADFQRRLGAKRPGEVASLLIEAPDGSQQIINVRIPE